MPLHKFQSRQTDYYGAPQGFVDSSAGYYMPPREPYSNARSEAMNRIYGTIDTAVSQLGRSTIDKNIQAFPLVDNQGNSLYAPLLNSMQAGAEAEAQRRAQMEQYRMQLEMQRQNAMNQMQQARYNHRLQYGE